MNGQELLTALGSGGAGVGVGFWGMIRWVQGGLAKKVDTKLFDERTKNMQKGISEIKDTVKAVKSTVDTQTTSLALIQQSLQNIENRPQNIREG